MAFSFGNTTTTAPAGGGGFSFGATAPATASTAAPTSGGFSFGGSTSAPAPSSGFSFGGASATTTAPPAAGGLFGSTPAPAPPSTSAFPSTSPASSTFNTSFQTPATGSAQPQQPNVIMTANTPYKSLPPNIQKLIDDIFNMKFQHEQTMASISTMQPALLQSTTSIKSSMQNIDSADIAAGLSKTYENIHLPQSSASSILNDKITSLQKEMKHIQNDLKSFRNQTNDIQSQIESTFEMIVKCGVYPLQATIARRCGGTGASSTSAGGTSGAGGGSSNNNLSGMNKEQLLTNVNELQQYITFNSSSSTTSTMDMAQKLNNILLENSLHVDFIEGMPSVYLWNVIDELVEKINGLYSRLKRLGNKIEGGQFKLIQEIQSVGVADTRIRSSGEDIIEELNVAVQNQIRDLLHVSDIVANLKNQMQTLRTVYKDKLVRENFDKHRPTSLGMTAGGTSMNIIGVGGQYIAVNNVFDPFAEADEKEREYERRLDFEVQRKRIEAVPTVTAPIPPSGGSLFGSTQAPTPAPGGLFGSTQAPAPAPGGLFGSTQAPAPATGGLFGATTPVPASGGLFGSTQAPAPAPGGLFGSTQAPTPAPGGLFGSTQAPAPAPGGLFGSTPASAPGGLFGSTTPAPSSGGLFGSTTPAPAGASLFGSSPAAAPATGGFFGSNPAAAPAAGGLFGSTSSAASISSTGPRTRRKSGSIRRR